VLPLRRKTKTAPRQPFVQHAIAVYARRSVHLAVNLTPLRHLSIFGTILIPVPQQERRGFGCRRRSGQPSSATVEEFFSGHPNIAGNLPKQNGRDVAAWMIRNCRAPSVCRYCMCEPRCLTKPKPSPSRMRQTSRGLRTGSFPML
jgi:hypothetical protein